MKAPGLCFLAFPRVCAPLACAVSEALRGEDQIGAAHPRRAGEGALQVPGLPNPGDRHGALPSGEQILTPRERAGRGYG